MAGFHWADYVILILVPLISLGIGLYHAVVGGKQNTINEYLLADRKLKWIPVGLSILVTFMSAVMYTGVPAEVYGYGFAYILSHIGKALAVVFTVLVFVPLLYPLKLTSAYEYLERRFNSKTARLVGSIIGMLNMGLHLGVVVYAPAIALEAVSKFPAVAAIVIETFVGIIYTTLGGIRGVVWADVFQFGIMFAGLLAILIQGAIELGGIGNIWQLSKEGGRTEVFDVNPDPKVRHTVWSLIIGGTFAWLANVGVNQSNVQRFSAVPNLRAARGAVLISLPGFFIWGSLATMMGLVAYAYYHLMGCDPLVVKEIRNINQIMPLFVGDVFHFLPGFAGLFVASLFSGSLSTLSSGINGLAAMAWEDMLKQVLTKCKINLKERHATWVVKGLVVFFGLVVMGIAFLVMRLGGPATQILLKFFGASGGPLVGMFLLGGLFPCANWIGASLGGIIGLTLCMWITIGAYTIPGTPRLPPAPTMCNIINNTTPAITTAQSLITSTVSQVTNPETTNILEPFYRVSYLWYAIIGILTVLIVGLIISFITGATDPADVSPELIIPIYKWYCCCLPKKCRKCLACGVDQRGDDGYEVKNRDAEKYEYDNPTMDPVTLEYGTYRKTDEA